MSGEIFIHIGFHKTATTYLQKNIFPNIEGYEYQGRYYRDPEYGNELYRELMFYLTKVERCSRNKEIIRTRLRKSISEGNVIISDEWITSNYDGFFYGLGSSWSERISRLIDLVSCFEYKILLVERDVVDLSFSMYCEFKGLSYAAGYTSYEDFCKRSPDVDAIMNVKDYLFEYLKVRPLIFDFDEAPVFSTLQRYFDSSWLVGEKINGRSSDNKMVFYSADTKFLAILKKSKIDRFLRKIIKFFSLESLYYKKIAPLLRRKAEIEILSDSERSNARLLILQRRRDYFDKY